MTPKSESQIEKAVCDHARKRGAIVMKLSGMNQKGQPDRMFLYGGVVLFIEFKRPGNKPTALQKKWMSELAFHGFAATWTDDIQQGKHLIDTVLFPEDD